MVSHPPLYAYHGGITKEQTVMFWPTGVVDDTNPVPVCHKTTPTPSPLSTSPTLTPTSSPISTSSPPENASVVVETNLVGHLQPPIHRLSTGSPADQVTWSWHWWQQMWPRWHQTMYLYQTLKPTKQCIDFILFGLNWKPHSTMSPTKTHRLVPHH